jgi:uncharacterized protein
MHFARGSRRCHGHSQNWRRRRAQPREASRARGLSPPASSLARRARVRRDRSRRRSAADGPPGRGRARASVCARSRGTVSAWAGRPGQRSMRALAAALRGAIRLYQLVLSPMLGAHCRFLPTCSAYASEAIDRHGPTKGLALAIRRVARCHPLHPGGFDPVPAGARGGARIDSSSSGSISLQRRIG